MSILLLKLRSKKTNAVKRVGHKIKKNVNDMGQAESSWVGR